MSTRRRPKKPPRPRRRAWTPGKRKGLDLRAIQRLAERGVVLEDILASWGLGDLGPDELRRVEEVVAAGLATFRVRAALRIENEGVRKGKVHPLLAIIREHLGWDQPTGPQTQELPEVNEAALLALFAQLAAGGGPHGAPGETVHAAD